MDTSPYGPEEERRATREFFVRVNSAGLNLSGDRGRGIHPAENRGNVRAKSSSPHHADSSAAPSPVSGMGALGGDWRWYLPYGVPGTRALVSRRAAGPLEHLASVIWPEVMPTREEEGTRLYRSVYWLWSGLPQRSQSGECPGAGGAERPAFPARTLPPAVELANWRVATRVRLADPGKPRTDAGGSRPHGDGRTF